MKKMKHTPKNTKFRKNPFVLDADLVLIFKALGQTSLQALVNALIIQRIARIQATVAPQPLSFNTDELLDLFCFIGPRTLKRCIALLRDLGIWQNTPYKPQNNMHSYTDIKISWEAIARLAKQVRRLTNERN